MDLTPEERAHPLMVRFEDATLVSQGRIVGISPDSQPASADARRTTEHAQTTIIQVESGTIDHDDGRQENLDPGCYAVTSHGLFRQIDAFAH